MNLITEEYLQQDGELETLDELITISICTNWMHHTQSCEAGDPSGSRGSSPKGSLPCSQESGIGNCLEPDESSPHPYTLLR